MMIIQWFLMDKSVHSCDRFHCTLNVLFVCVSSSSLCAANANFISLFIKMKFISGSIIML